MYVHAIAIIRLISDVGIGPVPRRWAARVTADRTRARPRWCRAGQMYATEKCQQ